MPEETKPDSFDWVKARSECSIEGVFQILKQVVTSNVESAKTIFNRSDITFTVRSLDRRFVVTREDSIGSGVKVGCHVAFALSNNSAEITVTRMRPQYRPCLFFQQSQALCRMAIVCWKSKEPPSNCGRLVDAPLRIYFSTNSRAL